MSCPVLSAHGPYIHPGSDGAWRQAESLRCATNRLCSRTVWYLDEVEGTEAGWAPVRSASAVDFRKPGDSRKGCRSAMRRNPEDRSKLGQPCALCSRQAFSIPLIRIRVKIVQSRDRFTFYESNTVFAIYTDGRRLPPRATPTVFVLLSSDDGS